MPEITYTCKCNGQDVRVNCKVDEGVFEFAHFNNGHYHYVSLDSNGEVRGHKKIDDFLDVPGEDKSRFSVDEGLEYLFGGKSVVMFGEYKNLNVKFRIPTEIASALKNKEKTGYNFLYRYNDDVDLGNGSNLKGKVLFIAIYYNKPESFKGKVLGGKYTISGIKPIHLIENHGLPEAVEQVQQTIN